MIDKPRLRDYYYPPREDLTEMFDMSSGWEYLWNREHHHVIENFLLSSPLGEHLRAYQQSVSPFAYKKLLGACLNLIVKLVMHQMKYPQQYGHRDILGSIMKGLSYSRAVFIRKYLGIYAHGKKEKSAMLALDPLTANEKRYDLTKRSMLFFARRYSELFGNRAIHNLKSPRHQKKGN